MKTIFQFNVTLPELELDFKRILNKYTYGNWLLYNYFQNSWTRTKAKSFHVQTCYQTFFPAHHIKIKSWKGKPLTLNMMLIKNEKQKLPLEIISIEYTLVKIKTGIQTI